MAALFFGRGRGVCCPPHAEAGSLFPHGFFVGKRRSGWGAAAPTGEKMLDKYKINVVYFSKGQDKRRSVKLRPLSFPAGQGHTNDFTVH